MKLTESARREFAKAGKRGAKTTHSRYSKAERSAQIKAGIAKRKLAK